MIDRRTPKFNVDGFSTGSKGPSRLNNHTVDGQYNRVANNILGYGVSKNDRTGTGTISTFGQYMEFDISCGKIPLLTTKKVHVRSIIHELLWMLSGDTNIRYLKENKVNIWDSWIDPETAEYHKVDADEIIAEAKNNGLYDELEKYITQAVVLDVLEQYSTATLEELEKGSPANVKETLDNMREKFKGGHGDAMVVTGMEEAIRQFGEVYGLKTKVLVAGDLPNVYGKQWRRWESRISVTRKEFVRNEDKYRAAGFEEEVWYETGKPGAAISVLSREIDQISNIIKQLKTNPDDRRIILNAYNVGEIDLMALPPCFTENALVEVSTGGYKKIADIEEGELVLTDKNRHRSVLEKWKTPYKGKMISIIPAKSNIPIEATPNHPFLVKDKGWVNAADLEENDFLAISQTNYEYNHSFFYDRPHYTQGRWVVIEKHVKCEINDYYTFGYFLGNGWMINENRIHFSIPVTKVDEILPKIRRTIKVSEKKMDSETVKTFETRSLKWSGPFSDFGKNAHNKKIPDWVMRSSKEAKIAFLEGFMDADGYVPKDGFFSVCTTSPHIAYGLQRLYSEFGFFGRIAHQKRNPTKVIEGRTVNQRDTYTFEVNTRPINNMTNHSFDDELLWVAIKSIKTFDYDGYVYNLHVEEDNTYTVNNIITHNCHALAQFWTRELTLIERVTLLQDDEVSYQSYKDYAYGLLNDNLNTPENNAKIETLCHEWLDGVDVEKRELSSQLYQRS